ncbi:MAG: O-antigen ligase family protein [Bacteroidales bacterium]|nr:O-antigen ligase family protein [Bacteroidales bacterium]
MVSILIYLSTTALAPHFLMILALIWTIVKNYNTIFNSSIKSETYKNIIFISLIVVLSFINSLIHFKQISHAYLLFPYTALMFGSFIIAKYIDKKSIELLVFFIAFEALIGVVEFLHNINSILFWKDFFEHYSSTNLIYFKKVFGLSENSSNLAIKLLSGFILMSYYKLFTTKQRTLLYILFSIALILSFQRTSIIVLIFYLISRIIQKVWTTVNPLKLKIIKFKIPKRILQISLVLTILILTGVIYKTIIFQLSKGNSQIELSGREKIWPSYISFIQEHPIYGNYSQKYMIDYKGEKNSAHAHNSFLQVLANHGFIIFLLFILLILINIKKGNALVIMALVILSLFQYALFWGISLIDIIFFIFAIHSKKNTF